MYDMFITFLVYWLKEYIEHPVSIIIFDLSFANLRPFYLFIIIIPINTNTCCMQKSTNQVSSAHRQRGLLLQYHFVCRNVNQSQPVDKQQQD